MIDGELVDRAAQSAAATAERSAVTIRPLSELAEFAQCNELFSDIWGSDPSAAMPVNLLKALSSAGSYVVGAYEGEQMLGACVGLWGSPDHPALHSHIAGVTAAARGRDLGFAMKLHQRAAALRAGVGVISWTFDPLVARNAHFNLSKLGARSASYAVSYYGEMSDAINAGDATDRVLVRWELDSPTTRAACDSWPGAGGGPGRSASLIEIPRDIETLRRIDPASARRWRQDVREQLRSRLDRSDVTIHFDRERCGYWLSYPTGSSVDQEVTHDQQC